MDNLCQSCSMPLNDEKFFGTNTDGSKNKEYCHYCYKDGELLNPNMTMEQMIEVCITPMKQHGMSEEQARGILEATLPTLKRWK
jgi:hypothetical protein